MIPERNSTDSIPDIEMAELPTNDQTALLPQTTIIDQIDFNICFKFMLIVIILNFMAPPIFIDFYYGIHAIEVNQYTLGNGSFDDKNIAILTKSDDYVNPKKIKGGFTKKYMRYVIVNSTSKKEIMDEMQSHHEHSSAPTPEHSSAPTPIPTPISVPTAQPTPVQTLPSQPAPCFFAELYFFCNGIVYSLLTFIAIVAIASVRDINRCITILLLMTSLIIFSFHVVWIVLIFKYF